MKTVQDQLRDELVTFEMQPAIVSRLVRTYHRAVAQRLWSHRSGKTLTSAEVDAIRQLKWLHPSAVWAGRVALNDCALFDSSWERTSSALDWGQSDIPAVEHLASGTDEPWIRWMIENLEQYAKALNASPTLRLAERPLSQMSDQVDEAMSILLRVWPEAALENHLLIRSLIYIEGGDFRSATFDMVFGAVLVGVASLESVAAIYEMLLHEGGHHSLFLRNTFEQFVTNESDIVNHPLRSDPRRIKGAIHAAHVLARMATGLARWSVEPDAPEEARERRDKAITNLSATLKVLRERARWTPSGERYFASLESCQAVLAG